MSEKPGKLEATSDLKFAQDSIGMDKGDYPTAEVDHANQEEDDDKVNEMEDETCSSSENLYMETMNESHSSQDIILFDDENQMEMQSSAQEDQDRSETTCLNKNEGIWWSSYKCPKCFKSFTCNNQRNKHVSECPYFDTDAGSDENSSETEQQVKRNSNGQQNVTAEQMEEDLDEGPLTLTSSDGDDVQLDGGSPIAEVNHFNHELDDEQMDNMEKQACCISESLSMETLNHQEANNELSANLIVNLNGCASTVDMESCNETLQNFPPPTSSTVFENSVDISDLGQVFNDISTETPTVPQEGQVKNSDKLEAVAPLKNLRSLFKCSKCEKTFTSNERRNLHVRLYHDCDRDSGTHQDSTVGVAGNELSVKRDTQRQHNNISENIIMEPVVKQGSSSTLIFSGDDEDNELDGMPDIGNKAKRYKCNFEDCNKEYKCARSLRNHQKIHTDGKQHKCMWEGCSSEFLRGWDLARHYRTHTGEKPYKCTVCQRAYSQSYDLVIHKNAKHGTGLFKAAP